MNVANRRVTPATTPLAGVTQQKKPPPSPKKKKKWAMRFADRIMGTSPRSKRKVPEAAKGRLQRLVLLRWLCDRVYVAFDTSPAAVSYAKTREARYDSALVGMMYRQLEACEWWAPVDENGTSKVTRVHLRLAVMRDEMTDVLRREAENNRPADKPTKAMAKARRGVFKRFDVKLNKEQGQRLETCMVEQLWPKAGPADRALSFIAHVMKEWGVSKSSLWEAKRLLSEKVPEAFDANQLLAHFEPASRFVPRQLAGGSREPASPQDVLRFLCTEVLGLSAKQGIEALADESATGFPTFSEEESWRKQRGDNPAQLGSRSKRTSAVAGPPRRP